MPPKPRMDELTRGKKGMVVAWSMGGVGSFATFMSGWAYETFLPRPHMLKSVRPIVIRDTFSLAYWSPIQPLALFGVFKWSDAWKNCACWLALVPPMVMSPAFGPIHFLSLWLGSGMASMQLWKYQRQIKPYPNRTKFDRAGFASSVSCAFSAAGLVAVKEIRANKVFAGVATANLLYSTYDEYRQFYRGDGNTPCVRQQGMVYGMMIGVAYGVFLTRLRRGKAAIGAIKQL